MLMKTITALIAATALSGCASMLQLDPEHFETFEVKQGVQSPHPVVIQWHAATSYEEIQELCKGYPGLKFGCAVTHKNVCLIVTHVKTAHKVNGHEMRHCFEWYLPPTEKFHQ